jgi:hypothetical protein
MNPFPLLCAVAALSLAGCARRDPVADNVNQSGNVVAAVNAANAAAAAVTTSVPPAGIGTAAAPSARVATAGIPAAFHGRWGMAPADCTTTRGDAKGLLVVTDDALHFYESKAVPAAHVQAGATTLSGDFAFTGEGQQWTRFETLQLQDGKLVRTESSPMASYTYVRCS